MPSLDKLLLENASTEVPGPKTFSVLADCSAPAKEEPHAYSKDSTGQPRSVFALLAAKHQLLVFLATGTAVTLTAQAVSNLVSPAAIITPLLI